MEAPDQTSGAAGDQGRDPEPDPDRALDPRPATDAERAPRPAPRGQSTPADPMGEPDDEVVAMKAAARAPGREVIQASPAPVVARQPDGTEVRLRVRGDERFNWQEDLNGFPVLRTDQGWYVYAKPDEQGKLRPTSLRVGNADPKAAGIKPGFKPARPATAEAQPKKTANGHGSASEEAPAVDPMGDEEADDAAAGD